MPAAIVKTRYVNNVGPQVRRYRYAKGWSQTDLAARLQIAGLDISRGTLAKVEARIRYVDDPQLIYFAEVLGVPVQDLFPARERDKRLHEFMERLGRTRF